MWLLSRVATGLLALAALSPIQAQDSHQISGDMSDMFVGGVTSDGTYLYATGSTYDASSTVSKCFLLRAPLDDLSQIVSLDALDPSGLEPGNYDTYCTSVAMAGSSETVVVGSAMPDVGPFENPPDAAEYGFHMHHMLTDAPVFAEYQRAKAFPEAPVLYPKAVSTSSDNALTYVASEYSPTASFSSAYEEESRSNHPNWLSTHRFGDNYQVNMHLFHTNDASGGLADPATMVLGGDESSARIGGILSHKHFGPDGEEVESLILAGSIVGTPNEYTLGLLGTSISPTAEEGFLMILNIVQDGSKVQWSTATSQTRRPLARHFDNLANEFASMDNYFTNLCALPEASDVYVVGASRENSGRLVPSLTKINLESGLVVWTMAYNPVHAFADPSQVYASALHCQVERDPSTGQDLIFVAGQQMDGATVQDDMELATGGAEVWLSLVEDGAFGAQKRWTVEIGSSDGVETLGGLSVDAEGNAVVVATTTGMMYTTSFRRELMWSKEQGEARSLQAPFGGVSEVFVVRVDKVTGSFDPPFVNPLEDPFNDFFGDEDLMEDPTLSNETDPIDRDQEGSSSDMEDDSFYPAYQSGPDSGPSYAGGMSYDFFSDTLYITGVTYGLLGNGNFTEASTSNGSCFVATLPGKDLSQAEFHILGTGDSAEACNDIQVMNNQVPGFLASRSEIVKTPAGVLVDGTTLATDNLVETSAFLATVDAILGELVAIKLIQDKNGGNVTITQVCQDPHDETLVYVVGGTTGGTLGSSGSTKKNHGMEPFVSKYNVEAMTEIWTTLIPEIKDSSSKSKSKPSAVALGCDVVRSDLPLMYIAGDAYGGALIDRSYLVGGPDQIFVVQLDTHNGEIYWARQVGPEDGTAALARGGGVVADENGDAVVFGQTTGHMFRNSSNSSTTPMTTDIFVMGFSRHFGSHQDPIQTGDLEIDWSDMEDFFDALNKTVTAAYVTWLLAALGVVVVLGCCAFYCIYGLSRQVHNRRPSTSTSSMGRASYEQVQTYEEREATNIAPADSFKDDGDDTSVSSATGLSRNL